MAIIRAIGTVTDITNINLSRININELLSTKNRTITVHNAVNKDIVLKLEE
ncbi:hypothetical protein VEE40_00550 [Escherichia coli]|nr:hypothetical protein VEE40_00550 [Escherichia coli]